MLSDAVRGDCPSCSQRSVLGKGSESELHCYACWDEWDGCWDAAKPVTEPNHWAVLPLPEMDTTSGMLLESQDVRVGPSACSMTILTDPNGMYFTGHGAHMWAASLLLAETLVAEDIRQGAAVIELGGMLLRGLQPKLVDSAYSARSEPSLTAELILVRQPAVACLAWRSLATTGQASP